MDLDTSILIFQFVFAHLAYFVSLKSNRYTDIDRTGNHSVLCLNNSVAQSQFSVLIFKFKTKSGAIACRSDMFIIEFYEVIFESGFCKAFKCHTCCINTKSRCAGMCRNTFCVNTDLTVFFCYFVFLKFCFSKSCFQFFFQPCFRRNNGITGIADSVRNKATIHGNNPGVLRICCHHHHSLFTMNAREIRIWCETTGYFFCNFVIMFHTF